MGISAKLILLAFGFWPFAVLAGNVRRTISLSFVTAAAISTLVGAGFYSLYGLGRHPRVSTVFVILFLLWPVALLVAKIREPSLAWKRLWLSVPLMSWFTTTTAISTNYPVNGAGGGFGMFVTLIQGWLYMLPIFGILQLFYLLFERAQNRRRAAL